MTINQKVLSRKYYKKGLWKITYKVFHVYAGSIFDSNENRLIKEYEKRAAIGEPWKPVNVSVQTNFVV